MIPLGIASGVGTVFSMASNIRQGAVAAKAAEFNAQQRQAQSEAEARLAERRAQQADNDALAEAQASAFDIENRGRAFRRQMAKRRAGIAASGIEPTGSPLLVAIDEAREAELDLEAMRLESENRQRGSRDEAAIERFQAEELRTSGRTARQLGGVRSRELRRQGVLMAVGKGISGAARVGRILKGG